ncbi:MAG: SRPBCC domain-containing protein [Pseudomonadota bacterium]
MRADIAVTAPIEALSHTDADGEARFGTFMIRDFGVLPHTLFAAWAYRFDEWFANRGAISRRLEVGTPYYFETTSGGRDHPHYGRILAFEPGRLLEMTWLNEAGTHGVETTVRVEVGPSPIGARLHLTHQGFRDEVTSNEHGEAWSRILGERLAAFLRAESAST